MGRVDKIISLPDLKTFALFLGGFFSAFFFTEMLFGVAGQVQGSGQSFVINKVKRIYEMMFQNPVWTIIGGGLLLVLIYAVRKLLPLLIGMICGLTLRILLMNLGYQEPTFKGYMSMVIP